jgi:hypothetical protein
MVVTLADQASVLFAPESAFELVRICQDPWLRSKADLNFLLFLIDNLANVKDNPQLHDVQVETGIREEATGTPFFRPYPNASTSGSFLGGRKRFGSNNSGSGYNDGSCKNDHIAGSKGSPFGMQHPLHSNTPVTACGKPMGEMGHQRMASLTMAATCGRFSRSGNEGGRSEQTTRSISS